MPEKLKRRERRAEKAPAAAAAEKAPAGRRAFARRRVSRAARAQFTSQLATLLDAGLPILRSLRILGGQMPAGAFKDVIAAVGEDVEGGSTLSESLAKHPKVFDDLYVNMVKAGEVGGVLTTIFRRLADFMEKSERLTKRIRGALMYPLFVVLFALGVLTFVMVYVIPKFSEIFRDLGEDLPAVTQALISTSTWLVRHWYAIPGAPLILFLLFWAVARSRGGRRVLDRIRLRFPLFGDIACKAQVSRVARTLGTLSASGVPLLQSLEIVKGAATNVHVVDAIERVHAAVKEGEPIAEPLGESGIFDDMVVNMIDVGEETGELDRMLMKVADTYDEEVDVRVGAMVSILEPALIIIMGVIVGFIVIALFLPLLKLQDRIGGG